MLTPASYLNNITEKINKYSNECAERMMYHKRQGSFSLNCHNTLSVINVILVGCNGLCMTILGSYSVDNTTIAVVGACFSFATAVLSRIIQSFSFNVLSVLHNQCADDFGELNQKFILLLNDVEKDEFNKYIYEQLITRFISVNEKSHLQTTHNFCFFKFCC